jgi:predicted DNA-binding transcriptional regulator AlpA
MDDKLLKIGDCLKIIPMAKSTWWKRIAAGSLPAPYHIGASAYWRLSDLQAFVADLGVPQTPQPKAHSHV